MMSYTLPARKSEKNAGNDPEKQKPRDTAEFPELTC